MIPAILANLLVLHRDRPPRSRLVLDLEHTKKTRYDRPGFRKLPEVVRALEAVGHVDRRDAVFKRLRTTVRATGDLRRHLASSEISLDDVARAEGEETIILTCRPAKRWLRGKRQPNTLVDYVETAESTALRAEMDEINRFLSSHSVTMEGSPKPDFCLYRIFSMRSASDPPSFNLHGRLYGGFWMSMKASERRHLRIDGEPVADLDFSSMFPSLAYHHVGADVPYGDLYALKGLERHRNGAKAGLSALLSSSSEMESLPSRLKAQLPPGWSAKRLKAAFAGHHPALEPLFGKDFGLDLMFTESRILLDAMKRLMARGIVALPMHDGMMVPESQVIEAAWAMSLASEEVAGVSLPVAEKDLI